MVSLTVLILPIVVVGNVGKGVGNVDGKLVGNKVVAKIKFTLAQYKSPTN